MLIVEKFTVAKCMNIINELQWLKIPYVSLVLNAKEAGLALAHCIQELPTLSLGEGTGYPEYFISSDLPDK